MSSPAHISCKPVKTISRTDLSLGLSVWPLACIYVWHEGASREARNATEGQTSRRLKMSVQKKSLISQRSAAQKAIMATPTQSPAVSPAIRPAVRPQFARSSSGGSPGSSSGSSSGSSPGCSSGSPPRGSPGSSSGSPPSSSSGDSSGCPACSSPGRSACVKIR